MGEKANVTSEELASAAAAGGIGAHAASVGGVVRDTVIGHGIDAVIARKKEEETEPEQDGGTSRA